MKEKYIQKSADKFLGFLFKNKINGSITFVVYLIIYKIVDMNTIQWFGDDIFLKNDSNFLEFAACAIGLGSIVFLVLGTIYKILTGQKF